MSDREVRAGLRQLRANPGMLSDEERLELARALVPDLYILVAGGEVIFAANTLERITHARGVISRALQKLGQRGSVGELEEAVIPFNRTLADAESLQAMADETQFNLSTAECAAACGTLVSTDFADRSRTYRAWNSSSLVFCEECDPDLTRTSQNSWSLVQDTASAAHIAWTDRAEIPRDDGNSTYWQQALCGRVFPHIWRTHLRDVPRTSTVLADHLPSMHDAMQRVWRNNMNELCHDCETRAEARVYY